LIQVDGESKKRAEIMTRDGADTGALKTPAKRQFFTSPA
jgi:hypothetical protein